MVPKNVTILEAADDLELFSQSKNDSVKSCMIPTTTPKSISIKNGLYNVKLMVKKETCQTQQKKKYELKSSK